MKISILTPTFNRAKLLDKLYTSILINSNNSNCDVEWLIMDDGSTDNTRIIVDTYIKENIINVQYFYQENSGKMSAINELVKRCTGDLILECDSDDYLVPETFKIIEDALVQCKDMANIYAMAFLKYDQNGNNMGNNFPEDNYESSMFDLYFKEGITGEKALVFNSSIRKKFKYRLENGEKFVTEARLHHEMDLHYNIKCFNKKIMICEYKDDGYSKNIDKLFLQNPKGYYEYFKEIFNQDMHGVTFSKRLYIYKHYILFAVLSKQKHAIKNVKGLVNKMMIAILYLPGKIATKRKFEK
jgi:glycosyltransferase involved in cell wall biosynthesis